MRIKQILRHLLGRMIRLVLGSPRLALQIKKIISRYPAFADRMRKIRNGTMVGESQNRNRRNWLGSTFFRQKIELVRDVLRNRYPSLYMALLSRPYVRQIYCGFVRLFIGERTLVQRHEQTNSDQKEPTLVSVHVLQDSLMSAVEHWQLGARIDG